MIRFIVLLLVAFEVNSYIPSLLTKKYVRKFENLNEITVFETERTATTARVITTAVFNCTVTASAEQMPRTCKLIGLFFINGSVNATLDFLSKMAN